MLTQESPTRFHTRTILFLDFILSNAKLFADDTSIFSVVHNIDSSAAELDNGLAKISHWLHQ